ncbi:hypothetical protein PTTG_05483 [Puccinia triticina 1-1 BBBD Race 1]|uniref:Uncharacterized protein n=2 Tax=Puccinia triticina TaxID=208348 RepID=A0A0C4EXD5_PUCT1|nr:uncharacterized protein PtA15_12A194 [Puccinia triticina]OAV91086.1 hypothetical protein PTTG_05483 [Puccinia triticina 1-1 BBBD Race 1]WAQ90208.1 hypothetical protein PtA15_12A194 [Puccinia triticina]WAR61510.1 hypothetical protein PtB15_12B197 [Puccinia triticina]
MGHIVFFSRHPKILNIAVESFKALLQLCGWVGLSQSIIHSRDFKIYLEPYDQVPQAPARCPLKRTRPDEDQEKVVKPPGQLLGSFTGPKSVPAELQEAFPGGRFRLFSAVKIKDQPSEAKQLLPPPE